MLNSMESARKRSALRSSENRMANCRCKPLEGLPGTEYEEFRAGSFYGIGNPSGISYTIKTLQGMHKPR